VGDEIAELSAHLEAASFRLLTLIREFDARGGWGNGFLSRAHWLSWRIGLDLGAAREKVRVARALGTLPQLSDALARGEVSYAKVPAVTRVATPETEAVLLKVARVGTAAHVERIVRGWRCMDRKLEAAESKRHHRSRSLYVHRDDDGMTVIRGRLTPEVGALLVRALAAARETLYQQSRGSAATAPTDHPDAEHTPTPPFGRDDTGEERPSVSQQQADALALLAETALHHGLDPCTAGERYQVVVHVDAAVLADPEQPGQSVLEDGPRVSAETSHRLACDATRVVMKHDAEGNLVEIGARTRTIPPALRRALHHRDKTCRFPGCSVPFGQGHHVRHWAQGGPTTLSNLALLCRRHHRAVHEEGYQAVRGTDGVLQFRRPDGWPIPEVPPAPAVPASPDQVLRAVNAANGIQIQARTGCPTWLGEPLNVPWAIDVLHPVASRPREPATAAQEGSSRAVMS
jgi:5-methylcytosine-specific restriction endonuclease McrA